MAASATRCFFILAPYDCFLQVPSSIILAAFQAHILAVLGFFGRKKHPFLAVKIVFSGCFSGTHGCNSFLQVRTVIVLVIVRGVHSRTNK